MSSGTAGGTYVPLVDPAEVNVPVTALDTCCAEVNVPALVSVAVNPLANRETVVNVALLVNVPVNARALRDTLDNAPANVSAFVSTCALRETLVTVALIVSVPPTESSVGPDGADRKRTNRLIVYSTVNTNTTFTVPILLLVVWSNFSPSLARILSPFIAANSCVCGI